MYAYIIYLYSFCRISELRQNIIRYFSLYVIPMLP